MGHLWVYFSHQHGLSIKDPHAMTTPVMLLGNRLFQLLSGFGDETLEQGLRQTVLSFAVGSGIR